MKGCLQPRVCVWVCVFIGVGVQQGALELCHAPCSSLSWALTCPSWQGRSSGHTALSTAPLAAVLTLQQCCDTLVFHLTLPFSFPSFPHLCPRASLMTPRWEGPTVRHITQRRETPKGNQAAFYTLQKMSGKLLLFDDMIYVNSFLNRWSLSETSKLEIQLKKDKSKNPNPVPDSHSSVFSKLWV